MSYNAAIAACTKGNLGHLELKEVSAVSSLACARHADRFGASSHDGDAGELLP